jgi:subtilase family protein
VPGEHNFEYLPLLLRQRGEARLNRPPEQSPLTIAARRARHAHTQSLIAASSSLSANWLEHQENRRAQVGRGELPTLPQGVPFLLKIDPLLDLDFLRERFSFEIVAEQEEGYVLVASEDIELTPFLAMVRAFAESLRGSGSVAYIHQLVEDPSQTERLRRILSDDLFDRWSQPDDQQVFVVDIGIACTGTREIPKRPSRGKRDSDADWARKTLEWNQARNEAYNAWDEIRITRENEIARIIDGYNGNILHLIDDASLDAVMLPDSFTIRLRIIGRGLKDFVLNYPYIFEVVEPEDITLPQREGAGRTIPGDIPTPVAPDADAPAVCVIDSGVQEGHPLIQPAIDTAASFCFLRGQSPQNVGDFVRPAGHGTRVAGAVLYGEVIPRNGTPKLPFWIQNARVLDENNRMPIEMPPPEVMRAVVERFSSGPRRTKIFNHSINATTFCRTTYMSAWAAEIDLLCGSFDVLIVQSAGNLLITGVNPHSGVTEHLAAGRDYPEYLCEPSTRIANPAQSLQALTVGSIAYGALEDGTWRTFAPQPAHPSAFSRSGPGIWGVIKPEVVEYGGDHVRTLGQPPNVQSGGRIPAACPELIRSTMYPPGPSFDRDQVGTSFAAPKVSRLAAQLERLLPTEPALLYRALIIQSARWPEWADLLLTGLRVRNPMDPEFNDLLRESQFNEVSQIFRCIGYGVPDEGRATSNTDYRTTFITAGETSIRAREGHIYQVPIPIELRRQADDFDIRIDVTLSYVAQPRRTRRNLRRYLSTWLDWKSSRLGEGINDFRLRAIKEESEVEPAGGAALPWTLQHSSNSGFVRNTKRSSGTVQKDWAIVKSNTLPDDFCIAVVGHQGWSRDPDSVARYSLVVTLEILGHEISIYEPLRTAVIELKNRIEVEAVPEVEIEVD